jgi:nucleoporin NUP82
MLTSVVSRVVPLSYLEGLTEYVEEKLNRSSPGAVTQQPQTLDEQRQYLKQLFKYPTPHSLNILQHDLGLQAVNIKSGRSLEKTSLIQGPFRLQPAPHELEDTDGGDAVDIAYLGSGDKHSSVLENDGVGVLVIAYQDGKVDVCIDIEKAEGKWIDTSDERPDTMTNDLPCLVVYETIDIGRGMNPNRSIMGNYPVLVIDPVLSCILYVYHAQGIHSISLVNSIWPLSRATSKGDVMAIEALLSRRMHSDVREVMSTFCQSRR